MTFEEFEDICILFENSGREIKEYPQTRLINMTDCDGVIQSYYASTKTAVFRDGNDKRSRKVTVRNMEPERFIKLCSDNSIDDIQEIYFD